MEDDGIKLIENYEVTETIRKSAEGIIYRAIEKISGSKVLIKIYYPELAWSDAVLSEFFNLAGYLRFVEHVYFLSIVDIGKHNGKPYIVFSDHLAGLLCNRQTGLPSQKETVDFLYNIAEALDYLHKQEILHGGLSPENIAIDPNGYPLLFDFGLSGVFKKLLLENMDDGFDNLSISDLKYTAPEHIIGRNLTRASDIYAFGIVAYYYIFGEYPFDGQYTTDVALSQLNSDPVPVQLPKGISVNTLQVVEKCVQVNPEKRFTSFSQLLGILDGIKSGRRARLRFDRRFALKAAPNSPKTSGRLTKVFAGVVLFVISFSAIYYLSNYNKQDEIPPPSTVTSAITATVKPIQTQEIVIVKPTGSPIFTPTMPAAVTPPGFKLAFEGETAYLPKDIISTDNLPNLQEVSRLGYGKPEDADVAADNNHTALATSAGVFIFEGNQFNKWIDPGGWATSVQFSPDDTTLAIGLATGEIQLWDWQNDTKTASLTGEWQHTGKINRILFSQGSYLYSASADRHVIVWDWKSGKSIRDIAAHSQPVNDIAVTSDGKVLVTCSDDKLIRVWDLASSSKLYELGSDYFDGSIKAVALSSDDAYLAAGGVSGFLYQWKFETVPLNVGTKLQPRADIVPVAQRIWSLQFIRDDQELLVGVDDGKSLTYDATRIKYGGISLVFEIPSRQKDLYDAFGSDFEFASFSVFSNNSIISVNWNGGVTFQQNQIISPMFDNLDRLDFSPDGSILAAGGKYGSTHVWELTTNQTIYQNFYDMPFGDPIAPDGSTIAIIVPSNDPRVGDLYQLKKLTGAQTTIDLSTILPNGRVGYTRDGSIFIAADLQTAKAWDFAAGNEVDVQAIDYFGCRIAVPKNNVRNRLLVNSAIDIFLPGEDAQIDALCPKTFQVKNSVSGFSRDLNLLAFVNSNGLLEAYDVLRKTPPWQPYLLEKSDPAISLAVSPDAAIIAVGTASGRIIFFDGKTGQPLREIVGNFGKLQAIKFSEDGTKLATAGSDGVVRIFGIVEIE